MRQSFRHVLHLAVLLIFLTISTSMSESPPKIVKQPTAGELLFEVGYDSYFLLECEAEGDPVPEYRWTKDGQIFNWQKKKYTIFNRRHGTLNITLPSRKDKGRYQCFANNTFGTATSNSVTVVENNKYSFKNEQVNKTELTVVAGEPFNISCNPIPTGRPKPKLDWVIEDSNEMESSIDNSRITVDPYGTLWFSSVTSDDSYYTFKFAPTIKQRREMRCPTKLNVVDEQVNDETKYSYPKRQYVTPRNENVLLGDEIELFCIYSGNPFPETIWFKNGLTIIDDNVQIRNHNKSLFIFNVTVEDRGTYTCNVSNGGPTESYDIELDVMVQPHFIISPDIVEQAAGETAVIKCVAGGNPEPAIEWIHNGRPISEAPPNPRRYVTPESITITELTESDIGNYGCNASNRVGYVYKDVHVNILNSSLKFPEYATLNGTPVTIGCGLFGSSKPTVNWTRDNVELTDERYSTLDNGGLRISEVSFTDTGNYTCFIASSNHGEVITVSKLLSVKEPTQVTNNQNVSEIVEGSSFTFNCIIEADSPSRLNVAWFANDSIIDFDNTTKFVKINASSMAISTTTELDSGTYTCLVDTGYDRVNATAKLIVQKRPLTEWSISGWLIGGVLTVFVFFVILGITVILCSVKRHTKKVNKVEEFEIVPDLPNSKDVQIST